MMLIAVIPLLWPTIPPLVDLPGHMGRYAIELAPPDSPLHRWYEFKWAIIGNLGVDLLVIPLSKLFGLELAVKLIVLMIPPLTAGALLFVAREVHGELPPSSALALPLVYGFPFQFGFVNFTLSMALAFFGFALWLRLGRLAHYRLRAAIFVPYGIALWLTHSFGWGVLGLLAASSELITRHRSGRSWLRSGWETGLAMLPLMPPLLLMLVWRSGHVSGKTGDWFNWPIKWYYVRSILRNDGTPFDAYSGYALLLVCALGFLGIAFQWRLVLMVPALVLIVTFILLPRVAMGSAYADMRLAPYMVAVLLIALVPRVKDMRARSAIAIVAVGFFMTRVAVQTVSYINLENTYQEQLAALDHVKRGSRLFAVSNLTCLSTPYRNRLDHIEAFAIIRKQAFVNGQWAMAGAQLLRVDYPAAKGFSEDPTQVIRPGRCKQPGSYTYPAIIGLFPRKAFDYLWLINFVPEQRPDGDKGLAAIWENPRGVLYRIRQTPNAG
jgi:hypothetical protein